MACVNFSYDQFWWHVEEYNIFRREWLFSPFAGNLIRSYCQSGIYLTQNHFLRFLVCWHPRLGFRNQFICAAVPVFRNVPRSTHQYFETLQKTAATPDSLSPSSFSAASWSKSKNSALFPSNSEPITLTLTLLGSSLSAVAVPVTTCSNGIYLLWENTQNSLKYIYFRKRIIVTKNGKLLWNARSFLHENINVRCALCVHNILVHLIQLHFRATQHQSSTLQWHIPPASPSWQGYDRPQRDVI